MAAGSCFGPRDFGKGLDRLRAVTTASKDPSFDERLGRLEAIVNELERGELGLETAIERYQEGVELLKGCHGILARFKRRVEELSGEAEAALKPFAGDPDADPPEQPEPGRPDRIGAPDRP